MKKTLSILAIMAVLFFSGCRSQRMNIPEAPIPAPRGTVPENVDKPVVLPPDPTAVAEVEEVPVEVVEEVEEEVLEALDSIHAREERFTFAQEEDKTLHDPNLYFVILGSFRSADNANRFMDALVTQGFQPVILISESGLHLVSIDSFTDEDVARIRVQRIRSNYPEYKDAWLLIRKK